MFDKIKRKLGQAERGLSRQGRNDDAEPSSRSATPSLLGAEQALAGASGSESEHTHSLLSPVKPKLRKLRRLLSPHTSKSKVHIPLALPLRPDPIAEPLRETREHRTNDAKSSSRSATPSLLGTEQALASGSGNKLEHTPSAVASRAEAREIPAPPVASHVDIQGTPVALLLRPAPTAEPLCETRKDNTSAQPLAVDGPEEETIAAPIDSHAGAEDTPPIRRSRLGPIAELWREAWDDFCAQGERPLVEGYKRILSIETGDEEEAPTPEAMKTLVARRTEELDKNAWKVNFRGHDLKVKDFVEPVIQIVERAKGFVGQAMSVSPPASLAWAGVCLLLPLLLNPSSQERARVKALEGLAATLSQCVLRESKYHRLYEDPSSGSAVPDEREDEHVIYRNSLKKLYVSVVVFLASSTVFLSGRSAARLAKDTVKWDKWEGLFGDIQSAEASLLSFVDQWKNMQLQDEWKQRQQQHQRSVEQRDAMTKEMDRVRELVHDIRQLSEDCHRSKLLRWLASTDPSANYNLKWNTHQEGTGDWMINSPEFWGWTKRPNSVLWLHGKAGAGKSVLSATAITHLKDVCQDAFSALAYFFFDFQTVGKQTTEAMLRSLVAQVCGSRPDISEPLAELSRLRDLNQHPSLESLEKALIASCADFSRVFLVVDALDECPIDGGERARVLERLQNIHSNGLQNLHIFLTSRNELDIREELVPLLAKIERVQMLELLPEIRDSGLQSLDQLLGRKSEYDSTSFLESVFEQSQKCHKEKIAEAKKVYQSTARVQMLECLSDKYKTGIQRLQDALTDLTELCDREIHDLMEKVPVSATLDMEKHQARFHEDVTAFIQKKLAGKRWETKRQEVTDALIENAQGMFQYVKLQVDALERANTFGAISHIIKNLPKGLDDTYSRILSQIDPPAQILAFRALQWLSFYPGFLTATELAHVVIIDPSACEIPEGLDFRKHDWLNMNSPFQEDQRLLGPANILYILSALVVGDADLDPIRLSHFSVREYLTSERCKQHKEDAKYYLDEHKAKLFMLSSCLLGHIFISEVKYPSQVTDDNDANCIYDAVERLQKEFPEWETVRRNGMVTMLENEDYNDWIFDETLCTAVATQLILRCFQPNSPSFSLLTIFANTPWSPQRLNDRGRNQHLPLQEAVRRFHVGIIRLVVQAFPEFVDALEEPRNDHDVRPIRGLECCSALHTAASRGRGSAVSLLLKAGADPFAESGRFSCALEAAMEGGRSGGVLMLIEKVPNLVRGCKAISFNPLVGIFDTWAYISGNDWADLTERFASLGADVNGVSRNLRTPLYMAAEKGRYETTVRNGKEISCLDLLLQLGARVNRRTGGFGSAFAVAAASQNYDAMRTLLSRGARVDAPNKGWDAVTIRYARSRRGRNNEAVFRYVQQANIVVQLQDTQSIFGKASRQSRYSQDQNLVDKDVVYYEALTDWRYEQLEDSPRLSDWVEAMVLEQYGPPPSRLWSPPPPLQEKEGLNHETSSECSEQEDQEDYGQRQASGENPGQDQGSRDQYENPDDGSGQYEEDLNPDRLPLPWVRFGRPAPKNAAMWMRYGSVKDF